MKNKNGFLFLLLVFLSLAGCYNVNTYIYVPPHSTLGKMCMMGCLEKRTHCQHMCNVHKEQCQINDQENAVYRYNIYHDEQKASHREDNKFIYDFDDSNCCKNIPCDCQMNFDICYRDCGGKIIIKPKTID